MFCDRLGNVDQGLCKQVDSQTFCVSGIGENEQIGLPIPQSWHSVAGFGLARDHCSTWPGKKRPQSFRQIFCLQVNETLAGFRQRGYGARNHVGVFGQEAGADNDLGEGTGRAAGLSDQKRSGVILRQFYRRSVQHPVVNFGRLARSPVDRDHVLRAGRHDHDAVDDCT